MYWKYFLLFTKLHAKAYFMYMSKNCDSIINILWYIDISWSNIFISIQIKLDTDVTSTTMQLFLKFVAFDQSGTIE